MAPLSSARSATPELAAEAAAPPAWRIAVLAAALAGYALLFRLLFPTLGPSVAMLSALVVVLAGWWFGKAGGVLTAVACIALDGLLFAGAGGADLLVGLPDIVAKLVIGFTVGSLRDLRTASTQRVRELERTRKLLAELEGRSLQVVESASDIIYLTDMGGRFTYVNPVAAQIMEYPREQLVGMDFRELVREDHRDLLTELYRSQAAEGRSVTYAEFPAVTGGGTEVWIGQNVQLLRTPEGDPTGFQAVARDVTAGRLAAESLERSNGELGRRVAEGTAALEAAEVRRRYVLAASPVIIFALTVCDGEICSWWISENLERLLGYACDEVVSREWFMAGVHPEDREEAVCQADSVFERGRVIHEFRFRHAGGEYRRVIEELRLVDGPGGEPLEVVGSWTDITERHEREARYRTVVESASDAIVTVDERGAVVFANPAAERIFGYTPQELVGTPLERLMPERLRERHRQGFAAHMRSGQRTIEWERMEVPGLHRDGREVPLELSFTAAPGGRQLTAVIRDLTDRHRAATLLRESEELYRGLYEENPSMLFMVSAGGEVLSVNHTAAAQLGYAEDELLGHPMAEILAEADREGAGDLLAACFSRPAETHRRELRKRHRDGRVMWVRTAARMIVVAHGVPAALVACEDVTALRQTTDELRQAERRAHRLAEQMAAVARAAAGVVAAESLQELRDVLENAVTGLIPLDAFMLAKHHPERGILAYMAEYDGGVYAPPQDVPVRGPAARVLEERRSLLTLRSDDPAAAGAVVSGTGRRSESVIRTPVSGPEGVIGLLVAHSYTQGAYDAQDVEVLETVAALAGTAMVNIRLLAERHASEEALRVSEERFRQLAENVREVFYVTDLPGAAVQYVSPAYEEVWGRSCEALLRKPWSWLESLHPDDRERIAATHRNGPPDERTGLEYRIVRPDGGIRWIWDRAFPIRDASGEVYRVAGIAEDITERRAAAEALRASEERYREVVEHAADALFVHDLEGCIVDVNQRACDSLGYTCGELVGMRITDVEQMLDAGSVRALVARLVAGEHPTLAGVHRRKDGSTFPVEVSMVAFTSGGESRVLGIARDVTERHLAEQALRESEARFRAVFDNAAIGIALADTHGLSLEVNPAMERMLGYTAAELRATDPERFTHPDDVEPDRSLYAEVLAGRRGQYALEKRYLRRDGQLVWGRLAVSLIRGAGGEPRYLMALVEDITAQRQAQEALRESEAQLRAIFDEAAIGVALVDLNGRPLRSNRCLREMLGYSGDELARMVFSEFTHPDDIAADWELFGDLLAGERSAYQLQKRYFRGDGAMVWGRLSVSLVRDGDGNPLYAVGMVENITEQKAVEQALEQSHAYFLQSQKMEAVGRLAGGVAHDFNNMLTAIRGNAELLLMDTAEDDPRWEELDEIRHAADRSADLTRQLLAFSRQQVLQPRVLDLNESVAMIERMLRRLIGEDIDLRTIVDPALGRVTADPGQMEQVLLNLAVNARDAMPLGGKLWIKTDNVHLAADDARLGTDGPPGPYVAISVVDTGCGMDAATLARIWEPFFTTKEQGKGTGLGLSTVYGIVRQSGGTVWAESEPGKGTAFTVYLPRTDLPSEAEGAERAVAEPVPRGSETVLVVEDEASVRRLAKRVLARSGFRVLEASEPREALELFRVHGAEVDLVLTDLVMPGMDGTRMADLLHEQAPGLRVIFSTGYSAEALDPARLRAGAHILLKPYSPDALVRKVREVLDA